jgi:hypothetical protein
MSPTKINILSIYKADILSSRNLANKIVDDVEAASSSVITLDFKGINASTRSFFDQLSSRISISKKKIILKNMNIELDKMIKLVRS